MKKTASKFILKRRINTQIKKLPVDDRFKPIISEIVFRRAIQFDRSYNELNEDINSLIANLKSIRVVGKNEMKDYDYALAVYCGCDKEILLSKDTLNESPDRIFQILAHELYHVMLKDNNGKDKFEKFNTMLDMKSNLYQELVAEKGSYRLVYPTKNDLTGYNSNAFCYDEIVFILDFIEAAYGVNEQDLLRNALNGRKALSNFLAKTIGEEAYEAEEFLDEMEVGGTLLLSSLYEDCDYKTTKNRNDVEFNENLLAGIDSMFFLCQSKIEERMRAFDVESIQDAINMKEEITFSQLRLLNILRDRLSYYKSEFDIDIDTIWDKCTNMYAGDIMGRLRDITQIIEHADMSNEPRAVDLINSARFLSYSDGDFIEKFFIKRNRNRAMSISKDVLELKCEDRKYTEGWDNKRIFRYIEKFKESERKTEKVSNIPKIVSEGRAEAVQSLVNKYKLTENQQKECMDALKKHKSEFIEFTEKNDDEINKNSR